MNTFAERLTVAVAANFAKPLEALDELWQAQGGEALRIVSGSSGKLYAQSVAGAPYDVFLSADLDKPQALIDNGTVQAEAVVEYARGRLVFWYPAAERKPDAPLLRSIMIDSNTTVALAAPRHAPYGQAAMAVIKRYAEAVEDGQGARLVQGENVSQAYHFVASGAAQAGLVALSQVQGLDDAHYFLIPASWHEPIRQGGVVLSDSDTARRFMQFLKSDDARAVLASFGYEAAP